jgi:hypothetical protein
MSLKIKHPYSGQKMHPNSKAVYGHELSTRTFNSLYWNGNLTTKAEVIEAYKNNQLLKIRNFGKVAYNEVFDWLDCEIEGANKPVRIQDRKQKQKIVLSQEDVNRKTNAMIRNIKSEMTELVHDVFLLKDTIERLTRVIVDRMPPHPSFVTERKYIPPANIE